MIFFRTLCNGDHTRRFVIRPSDQIGWEVVDEADSRVLKAARYDDWHRVERTRVTFERLILQLREQGWTEEQSHATRRE